MRFLSYHTKLRLKKIALVFLVILLVLFTAWICWVVWLQRFVVYTRDGVVFDFNRSTVHLGVQTPPEPTATAVTVPVEIIFDDNPGDAVTGGLKPLFGYSVDTAVLLEDFSTLRASLERLEPGTAVLLDVKSKFGNFYYSTNLAHAPRSDSIDAAAMDELIAWLCQSELYVIARVPAFRDSAFAQANQSAGVALASGALWTDADQCYWLDPANDTVLTNLSQICRELRDLGFDEVVFSDFRFPDSGSIVYSATASKEQIIQQAAQKLVTAFSGSDFTVSFYTENPAFSLPTGQSRLYLTGVAAQQADSVAEKAAVTDPKAQIVFLTESRDTRFDEYSVLRPIVIPQGEAGQ